MSDRIMVADLAWKLKVLPSQIKGEENRDIWDLIYVKEARVKKRKLDAETKDKLEELKKMR